MAGTLPQVEAKNTTTTPGAVEGGVPVGAVAEPVELSPEMQAALEHVESAPATPPQKTLEAVASTPIKQAKRSAAEIPPPLTQADLDAIKTTTFSSEMDPRTGAMERTKIAAPISGWGAIISEVQIAIANPLILIPGLNRAIYSLFKGIHLEGRYTDAMERLLDIKARRKLTVRNEAIRLSEKSRKAEEEKEKARAAASTTPAAATTSATAAARGPISSAAQEALRTRAQSGPRAPMASVEQPAATVPQPAVPSPVPVPA